MTLAEKIEAALADSQPELAAPVTEILAGMRSGLLDPYNLTAFLPCSTPEAAAMLDRLAAAGIVERGLYAQHAEGGHGGWCNNHFDPAEYRQALKEDGYYECSLCGVELDGETPVREIVQYRYAEQ